MVSEMMTKETAIGVEMAIVINAIAQSERQRL